MATVVREIERKYDPAAGATAALDAVKAMTGTAGVAAVSQQGGQLLDAVYYDTADLRPDAPAPSLPGRRHRASPAAVHGRATRPNHGLLTG